MNSQALVEGVLSLPKSSIVKKHDFPLIAVGYVCMKHLHCSPQTMLLAPSLLRQQLPLPLGQSTRLCDPCWHSCYLPISTCFYSECYL